MNIYNPTRYPALNNTSTQTNSPSYTGTIINNGTNFLPLEPAVKLANQLMKLISFPMQLDFSTKEDTYTPSPLLGKALTPTQAQDALTYLELSDFTYGANGAPEGWERLPISNINGLTLHDFFTGFDADTFKNLTTGEVCIAFRGSDLKNNDALEVSLQAFGVTTQIKHTYELAQAAKELYGDKLTFTGHSQGGALAQVAGLTTGNKTILFDGAGLADPVLEMIGTDKTKTNQNALTHIIMAGEFATDDDYQQDADTSKGGKNMLGNLYYLDNSGYTPIFPLKNNLTLHFLSPLREALEAITGKEDTTDDTVDTIQWAVKTFGQNISNVLADFSRLAGTR